jgi:ribosomal protein S18 acetylase RimI-like enzyme
MRADVSQLRTIENAAVRGWPALDTVTIDGWLARASSGGSIRANSVSALAYTGVDADASIDAAVEFYQRRGARVMFTITEVSEPAGLDARLAVRGFERRGEHATMVKAVAGTESIPEPVAHGITVGLHERPTPDWYAVYLEGLTGDRRVVAPRIVDGVPAPRTYFSAMRGGEVIASGLSVLDGELASVQCMATRRDYRRTGAARAVLAAIEAHASNQGKRWLYLQAEIANVSATTLYGAVGFEVAGRYHTRELPDR